MSTLYKLFGDNMIPYRTESAHCFVLMSSAAKRGLGLRHRGSIRIKGALWGFYMGILRVLDG